MTRKKVKLAYITNDSSRRAAFRKRTKGLLKKLSELSILCGIDACAIICSPYGIQPEVWPSPMEAQKVLTAFKEMPEMEQRKKMVSQESFLRQRIFKAQEQLKKQKRENRKKEVAELMFQGLAGKDLGHLSMLDLHDIDGMIDQCLKEINNKVEELGTSMSHNIYSKVDAPSSISTLQTMPNASGETSNVNINNIQSQQWFMDLMNLQDNLEDGGNEGLLPLDENSQNDPWYDMIFP